MQIEETSPVQNLVPTTAALESKIPKNKMTAIQQADIKKRFWKDEPAETGSTDSTE